MSKTMSGPPDFLLTPISLSRHLSHARRRQFFAGTDSAPHARHTKERDCGCAGCYTAHAALALYAEAFGTNGVRRGDTIMAAKNSREVFNPSFKFTTRNKSISAPFFQHFSRKIMRALS